MTNIKKVGEIWIGKTKDGREIYFTDCCSKPSYAIPRFCTFCGVKLEELQQSVDLLMEWDGIFCNNCGQMIHSCDSQTGYSEYQRNEG